MERGSAARPRASWKKGGEGETERGRNETERESEGEMFFKILLESQRPRSRSE